MGLEFANLALFKTGKKYYTRPRLLKNGKMKI